jgi:S1-C subfamily serine protease
MRELVLQRSWRASVARRVACACLALVLGPCAPHLADGADSLSEVIRGTQAKMVKIHGAGGVRGLEAYQSGFLISSSGHLLTVWSYVLDTDYIGATLSDGRKFEAKLVGFDPRLEMAVLKIEAVDLPYFDLATSVGAEAGTRVLAVSNLFGVATGDEADSVQHGVIAVKTRLDARRGTFETPYHGAVYVLDAMTNNPGAAGGALVNLNGELLGVLGKELRSAASNIWLNYAIPIDQLRTSAEEIAAGKFQPAADKPQSRPEQPADQAKLGLVLVPDVLERTPPYIDVVHAASSAAVAGLRPDDLIVLVGDTIVHSCKGFGEELARVEQDSPLKIVVMRGQELVEVVIKPAGGDAPDK